MAIDSSINLRNDLIFKFVFGYEKNERILIALLNAILGLAGNKKIVSLTFLNAFNLQEYLNDKLTILDVKVVDGTGARYNVEMQVAPDNHIYSVLCIIWTNFIRNSLKKKNLMINYVRLLAYQF